MILVKIGTEVHITSPVRKTFQVEADDIALSVKLALSTAESRYPNKDWSKPVYTTGRYTYKDIIWAD